MNKMTVEAAGVELGKVLSDLKIHSAKVASLTVKRDELLSVMGVPARAGRPRGRKDETSNGPRVLELLRQGPLSYRGCANKLGISEAVAYQVCCKLARSGVLQRTAPGVFAVVNTAENEAA